LKKQVIVSGLFSIICCLLVGCAGIEMKIDSINNPYLQQTEYKRFSFTQPHSDNKPKEQYLVSVVKKEMESKGFVHDEKAPQFLVDVSFSEVSRQVKDKNDKPSLDITKKVAIVFLDMIYQKQNPDAKLVWQGEASSNSSDSEFGTKDIEKCLIIGILQVYPGKFKSITKNVSSFSCM
jgi:hypothetical protein